MASPATLAAVSVEEYLSDARWERFEYAEGELSEIHVGSGDHSSVQTNIVFALRRFLPSGAPFRVHTEFRCQVTENPRKFLLPDLCVVPAEPDPRRMRFYPGAPPLVVEVKSPDDSLRKLFRKMEQYLAAGTQLGWLVVPEDQAVFVFRPGGAVAALGPGETIGAAPVLEGFQAPVDEFFA